MKYLWLLPLLSMLGFTSESDRTPKKKAQTKPNIIFILADDLGYGDLGCYGSAHIQTPNLDKMAKQGMKFSQCYAGAPVCAPSRSTLMTGLHTGHTPIRGNFSIPDAQRVPLPDSTVTVAEVLKKAGYTTGMFGKWGLGEAGTEGIPNKQGWDEFFGYLNQRDAHQYYPEKLWHNQEVVTIGENANQARAKYAPDLYVEKALDFVKTNKEKPFFLYLPVQIPHGKIVVPDNGIYQNKPWGEVYKRYAAMVTRLDQYVGQILQILDEQGLAENTIVFFSSDNGPAYLKEAIGTLNPDTLNSTAGMRGVKRDVYEGGIRVPMLVQWKGKIKPGSQSEHLWAFWDFLPTAAAIAGTKHGLKTDGHSVLPTLLGKPQAQPDYLYWEYFGEGKSMGLFTQAMRKGKWKAVKLGINQALELYDLSTDRGEKHNLASQNKVLVAEFERLFITGRIESKFWPINKDKPLQYSPDLIRNAN